MSIVYQYDRRHNVTYAYISESYYDKDKKQSRSKRTLLGRVNPETKEIEPTKKTKRSKPVPQIHDNNQANVEKLHQSRVTEEKIIILQAQIHELERKLDSADMDLQHEKEKMAKLLSQIKAVLVNYE